jgi:hypothetical protein
MKHDEPVTRYKQRLQILLLIGSRERSIFLGANFMYLILGIMLKLGLTYNSYFSLSALFSRGGKRVKTGKMGLPIGLYPSHLMMLLLAPCYVPIVVLGYPHAVTHIITNERKQAVVVLVL